MALENMTSVQGQILKKKFEEKLDKIPTRLSRESGGGGMRSNLNPGTGASSGKNTHPSPATGKGGKGWDNPNGSGNQSSVGPGQSGGATGAASGGSTPSGGGGVTN